MNILSFSSRKMPYPNEWLEDTKNNKNYSSEYEERWKDRELDLDMDTMDELVKFASLILDYGVKESSDVNNLKHFLWRRI